MGSNWMMVMLVVSLFGPVPAAWAVESADTGNSALQGGGCHPLLLGPECERYQARLQNLPAGPERNRLIAEQRALLLDRESACDCRRTAEAVILKPVARKAKLGF